MKHLILLFLLNLALCASGQSILVDSTHYRDPISGEIDSLIVSPDNSLQKLSEQTMVKGDTTFLIVVEKTDTLFVIPFVKGKINGKMIVYNILTNSIEAKADFKNGKLDGRHYRRHGQKGVILTSYSKGKREGISIVFDERGSAEIIEYWRKGKLVDQLDYRDKHRFE